MSNRSYVIVQTFIHSWRISTQTFVNSVSNKHHGWTYTRHRVQQTHSALPLTKARIGLERQRQTCAVWAKRTEYSIEQIRQSLQRLKIAKIVRMQNLHNFRTIDSVFSDTRLRYKLSIIDTRLSRNGYGRVLVTLHAHALVSAMTYEQLFICCLSNLPQPIVSIVLRKLAIVNTSSRKQEWTNVHSVVLHLIYQKFN